MILAWASPFKPGVSSCLDTIYNVSPALNRHIGLVKMEHEAQVKIWFTVGHRLRHWPNIHPALNQRFVFTV